MLGLRVWIAIGLAIATLGHDPRPAAAQPDFEQRFAILRERTQTFTDTERLHRLFDLDWEYQMIEYPERATSLGYPGQNHRWTDYSLQTVERRKRELRRPLDVLRTIDRDALGESDRLDYDLFERTKELAIEGARFPDELIPISQMSGVQVELDQTISLMPVATVKDFENIIARFEAYEALVDQTIELMKKGCREGVTPPRVTLVGAREQIARQLVDSPADSPLMRVFERFPPAVEAADRERLTRAALDAIASHVMPALEKLGRYFDEQYLPCARESTALGALPDGRAWYAHNIRRETTTDLTAQQIHELGLSEARRIRLEMDEVIAGTGFEGTFAEFCEFMRTDPRFFFDDPEALITAYRDVAKRIDPELPRLFGRLPRLPYGVRRIPRFMERSQTTAYYMAGSVAAGRPGYFYANAYDLKSRPKWEMEVLTIHEAVPGHHLQISLAQELTGLAQFRRHASYTAFVEGWGLYAEGLGPEMGFYTDPYSKFGQLTYEMWRAVRLVVDTGMHALGWSRRRAIDFFKENTGRAEHDIVVEIDRYIAWPGQALAYKIGQLKFRSMRNRATAELGADFDLRDFHDAVLSEGALPMDVLETRMEAWLAERKRP